MTGSWNSINMRWYIHRQLQSAAYSIPVEAWAPPIGCRFPKPFQHTAQHPIDALREGLRRGDLHSCLYRSVSVSGFSITRQRDHAVHVRSPADDFYRQRYGDGQHRRCMLLEEKVGAIQGYDFVCVRLETGGSEHVGTGRRYRDGGGPGVERSRGAEGVANKVSLTLNL